MRYFLAWHQVTERCYLRKMNKILITILACLCATRLLAQKPFDEEVRKNALTSDDGYRRRTNDERYEGLYSLNVGAPLLGVVAVTHGPVNYALATAERLTIQVPALKDHKAVGVSGTSFGLKKNYRIDAIIKAGDKKVIPVKEVLSPNYIYKQNLGIFGYLGDPQAPSLYVPVRASARPEADAAQAIRITFLPGANIGQFTWSYAKSVQGQCTAFREQGTVGASPPAAGGIYLAQQPIVITLPATTDLAPGDEVCLNVHFKALGDEQWRSKNIKLLVTECPR